MKQEFQDVKQEQLHKLRSDWSALTYSQRHEEFHKLERDLAEDLFLDLKPLDQSEILFSMPVSLRRSWLRLLPLDNIADVIQNSPEESRQSLMDLLDPETRQEVIGLLVYAEDHAGGLMTPHFIRLKPDMDVEVAIRYLRAYSKHHEQTIYYTYVVDSQDVLLGVVSFRDLLLSPPNKKVSEFMRTSFVSVLDTLDQEDVAKEFLAHHLSAIPVVNNLGQLKGVVTYDDIAGAIQKETTEDMQKIGGMEALELPYWKTSFVEMLKKRAGWLMILFLGEMFTATAMAHYESEIEKAVVLALFIPLIISSGGNSGSQASTLIIRAMALGEIKLRQWWKVLGRELATGLALGLVLGSIGLLRILIWPSRESIYGVHYELVAVTVACSLVGVVLWGATAGAMLPFVLRKLRLDPASASAPFVATLVDVTGLIIYFNVASFILKGTLM